ADGLLTTVQDVLDVRRIRVLQAEPHRLDSGGLAGQVLEHDVGRLALVLRMAGVNPTNRPPAVEQWQLTFAVEMHQSKAVASLQQAIEGRLVVDLAERPLGESRGQRPAVPRPLDGRELVGSEIADERLVRRIRQCGFEAAEVSLELREAFGIAADLTHWLRAVSDQVRHVEQRLT